jgi:outer membrane lipoprotein LolB
VNVKGKQLELAEIENWCMAGRSAAKYGYSGWQAGVHWCQNNNKTTLELTGPMSIGSVLIRYRYGELWIRESKDQLSISHDPERLLRSRLGFSVPLTALRFWLMGLHEPGSSYSLELNDDGRLKRLRQHQWVVEYGKYSFVDGYQLPGKIKLTKDAVRLKIMVDQWRLEQ